MFAELKKGINTEKYGIFFLTMSVIVQRLSMAVGSIFFVLSILCLMYRLFVSKGKGLYRLEKIYWVPFLIFAVCLLPATILSDYFLVSLRWFLNNALYAPMAFWIIVLLCKDRNILMKSFKVFTLMFLAEGVYSIIAYYAGIEARSSGFGGSTLGYACCLCMVLSVFFVGVLDEEFSKKQRRFILVSMVILVYALLTTGSRGGFGTFIVIAICMSAKYIWNDKRKLLVTGIICIAGVLIVFLNSNFQNRIKSTGDLQQLSFVSRFVAWDASYRMMLDHPLGGIGPGAWGRVYGDKYYNKQPGTECVIHAHNNVAHIMAETGIPGVFGYLFMMCAFFVYNFKKLLRSFNLYRLMIIGVILAFNCYGMIEYSFGLSIVVRTFWYLMGCLMVAANYKDYKGENGV